MNATGRVWSTSGTLLASDGQSMLWRRVLPPLTGVEPPSCGSVSECEKP
jgi:hypothetical protein